MLIIGLTGGMGTGKSTIANLFSVLGVPIIDADQCCKQLTQDPESQLVKQIVAHFGQEFINSSGQLDRKKLQQVIFNQLAEKKWLENLLHPLVYAQMQQQIKKIQHELHKPSYIILMIPLLFETAQPDFRAMIHRTLVIDLPEKMQIQRVKIRDNLSILAIQKIIQSQCSRKKKLEQANDIIMNKNLNTVKKEILLLHQQYLRLSKIF